MSERIRRGDDGSPDFSEHKPATAHRVSIEPQEKIFFAPPGFKEVEMLFNIGRVEGMPQRGFDLINANKQRRYFVRESHRESEERVRESLGRQAVLKSLGEKEGFLVYAVPLGTKPLKKVLDTAPYKREYMDRLAEHGERFLQKIEQLDSGRFGADINSIAIAHSGSEDDTYLTLVPPLAPPKG